MAGRHRFTEQERLDLANWYDELHLSNFVIDKFKIKYPNRPVPSKTEVRYCHQKLHRFGTVSDLPKSGRPTLYYSEDRKELNTMEQELSESETSDSQTSRGNVVGKEGTKRKRKNRVSSERESIDDPDYRSSLSGRVLRSRKRKAQSSLSMASRHRFTEQERLDLANWYDELHLSNFVIERFKNKYPNRPVPSKHGVLHCHQKLHRFGTVSDLPKSGRPKLEGQNCSEDEKNISEVFDGSTIKPPRQVSREAFGSREQPEAEGDVLAEVFGSSAKHRVIDQSPPSSSSKRRVTAALPEPPGEMGKYPCLLCHERIQNFTLWKKHVMRHDDVSVYVCSLCFEGFTTQKLWESHCIQHSKFMFKDGDDFVLPIRNGSVLLCEGCGQQVHLTEAEFRRSRVTPSLRLDMLRRHYRLITFYSDKNVLKRNKMIKNESIAVKFLSTNPCPTFPTACPVCEAKFETVSEISTHMGPNGPHPSAEANKNGGSASSLDQWLKNRGDLDYPDESPASLMKQFLLSLPTSDEMRERINEKPEEIDPDAEITCNLCWSTMEADCYNLHDCATSYTRRWLLNGVQIRCPCEPIYPLTVGLKDVEIPAQMLTKCWKIAQIPFPDEIPVDRGFQKGLCACISSYNCALCATEYEDIDDLCVHLLSCIQLNGYKLQEYSLKDLEAMLPLDELDESMRDQLLRGCKLPEKPKMPEVRMPERPKIPEVRVESVTSLAGQRSNVLKFKQAPEPRGLPTPQETDPKKSTTPSVPERPPFINQQLFTESPLPAIPNGTYICQQFPPACIPSCVPSSFACVFSPIASPGPVYFVYGEAASHVMNKGTKVATIALNQSSAAANITTPTSSIETPRMSTPTITSVASANRQIQTAVIRPQVHVNRFQSPAAIPRSTRPPPPVPSASPATRGVALIECPACRCSGTSQRFTSVPTLKEHLIHQHINVCPHCAACFVTSSQVQQHLNNRGMCPKPMTVSPTNAKYECNICNANFLSQPREYYFHLIGQHQNKVNFNEKTGQIFPMCHVELKEADRSTIISTVVENVVQAARTGSSPKEIVYIDLAEANLANIQPQQRVRPTPSPPVLEPQTQPCEADLSTDSSDSDVLGMFLVDQTMLPVETQDDLNFTEDAIFHCPICVEKFRYKHVLLAHVRKHIGIGNSCPLCMVQFDNSQHGVMHLMHECCKARDLICVECGRKGTSEEDLRDHKQTAHVGVQLECDICDKRFPLMTQFREHSKLHEDQKLELGEIPPQRTSNAASKSLTAGGICPICKAPMKQDEVFGHLMQHSKNNHSYCFVCKQKFPTVRKFKEHLQQHSPSEVGEPHVIMLKKYMDRHLVEAIPQSQLARRQQKERRSTVFTDAFVPVLSNDWANETGSAFEATQVPSTSAISVETGSREKGPKVSSISSEIHVVPPAPRSKQPPAAAEPEAQGEDEEITVVDPELEEDAGQRKDRPIQVCPICQQQFYTNLSMTEHMRTHSQDAGVTCEHVLPIPQDITVWVCRICCIAYASQNMYHTHAARHTAYVSCDSCSCLCFTRDQLLKHAQTHLNEGESGDNKSVLYACSICYKAMRNELLLHHHLNVVHGYPLIWICKMCSMGHPNRQQIDKHIRFVHGDQLKAQIGLIGTPYGYAAQRFQMLCDKQLAVCAHRKLHYQPPPGPIPEWLRNSNLVVGECAHRTFNAYTETVLACSTCGTLVPGSKFILENEEVRNAGQLHLTLVNETAALRLGSTPSVSYAIPRFSVATAGFPRPGGQQQVVVLGQNSAPPAHDLRSQGSNFTSTQQQNPNRSQAGALVQALQQPVGAVAHIVGSGTPIRPANLRSAPVATAAGPRPAAVAQRPPAASPMQPQQPTAPRPVRPAGTSNASLTCQICNVECSSVASFKVHKLRHCTDTHFCLECGTSINSEATLFEHISQNHSDKLKIEYACPVCPFSATNVQNFCDHVHESTISICYCCNLPIYNQSVYDTHMDKHLRRGPAFCIICDTALANASLVKLHQVVHACDRWFMCRDCGLCYSEENQADCHFKVVHLDPPERGTKCTECRVNVDASRHFTEKHKIYAAKSKTTQVLNKQMIHKVLGVDDTNSGESSILSAKELRMKFEQNVAGFDLDEKYIPFLTKSLVDLLAEANSRGYLQQLYQCATCKHFIPDSATLRQHLKQMSGHRQLHCLLEFSNRSDSLLKFSNSPQRFDADEYVLCGVCLDAVRVGGFASHQQQKHAHLANFACTVCFEIFGNQVADVFYHEYFHHNVGCAPDTSKLPMDPRYCLICGSGFSALEPGQLTKHYIAQHSQFATTPIGNNRGFHLCLICGLADVEKMHYDKHWNSHRLVVNDQLFEMEKRSVYLKSCVDEGGVVEFNCGHCGKNLMLGTDAVRHFVNEHMSAADAQALRQFHATHLTAKKHCRMCLFMNQI